MNNEQKLVPVVPTKEMMLNGSGCQHHDHNDMTCIQRQMRLDIWNKMLAAAPAPPAGDVEVLASLGLTLAVPNEAFNAQDSAERLANMDVPRVMRATFKDFEQVKAHVNRLSAEVSALQQRLNIADQRVCDLEKDKQRLDALESNFWDVRHHSAPLADTGDYTGGVEIVGRWMDKPHERVIGEDYNESLRDAIDQAMTADAYPPARPEYPELDAALSEENWHMNPCKQGHRDVGACGGQAFCHTCDETIIAATTLEAFEQWNASHPANPQ